jgi:hypothetical protein
VNKAVFPLAKFLRQKHQRQWHTTDIIVLVLATLGDATQIEMILSMPHAHKHLSNIDRLMAHTACLACFTSTVNGRSKKRENALEDVALAVGTQQNLSNLYSLGIYAHAAVANVFAYKHHQCARALRDCFKCTERY